jgi:poly(A)-specific ribonuclease
MDVGKVAFYPRLLRVLEGLSEAHFVAIDFELSGISTKKSGGASQEKSLQERYTETKEAAEKYRILQIGLTCVGQNDEPGHEGYMVKTYNFPLNPSFENKELNLERDFSFQSGAVDFLHKQNFDFSLPFTRGVYYLSRGEAEMAKQKAKELQDKRFDDIEIPKDDVDTHRFFQKVRSEIDEWLKDSNSEELCIVSS